MPYAGSQYFGQVLFGIRSQTAYAKRRTTTPAPPITPSIPPETVLIVHNGEQTGLYVLNNGVATPLSIEQLYPLLSVMESGAEHYLSILNNNELVTIIPELQA